MHFSHTDLYRAGGPHSRIEEAFDPFARRQPHFDIHSESGLPSEAARACTMPVASFLTNRVRGASAHDEAGRDEAARRISSFTAAATKVLHRISKPF